jgi:hypothetical protein
MSHREPPRLAAPRYRTASLAAVVCVSATLLGVVAGQLVGPCLASSAADGAVHPGLTPFDRETPAVANLNPGLRDALRHAATDATQHGVEIFVNSGWRSPECQGQLLRAAVLKYGSARPLQTRKLLFQSPSVGEQPARAFLHAHDGREDAARRRGLAILSDVRRDDARDADDRGARSRANRGASR